MGDEDGGWAPLPLDELSAVMTGAPFRWWVAGGWAVDLAVDRVTREHADVDAVVLREDLPAMRTHMSAWDLHAADPPGTLRPWADGEVLPAGVHDVWARRGPAEPWSLQLMVDDAIEDVWSYRRDRRIRRPVASLLGPASSPALPALAPEVQLLAKSRSPRPKDEADLRVLLPLLEPERRSWLSEALGVCEPGHPWIARLEER